MPNTYYTTKLLGLQEAVIKKIDDTSEKIEIFLEMEQRSHICPVCGMETNHVHDYCVQDIRDVDCFGKKVILHLRKRRYRCSCGKRFYEENTWLARYQRETQRTTMSIIEKCHTEQSYTAIAREFNVSMQTVTRRFDLVHYPNFPTLSNAYFMKERLYRVLELAKQPEPDMELIKKAFKEWIDDALESEMPPFVRCAKTYLNWFTPIMNSFNCPYTNGFTEGCNNKIKVIKRNAYGVHKFTGFRNRILYSFS